jgi:hypothetical protein
MFSQTFKLNSQVWTKRNTYKTPLKDIVQATEAMPWLRQLVAGLSPQRPGFVPESVHMGFVLDEVALGQVFL